MPSGGYIEHQASRGLAEIELMKEILARKEDEYSNKKAIAFSFGQVADVTAYQSFVFLTFTFYFTIIGLPVLYISIGFMIWSVWNAFNDPLLGHLSDRTHTKWGRRYPYIMAGLIPLAIVMFFVFSPPKTFGITDLTTNLLFFILIIIIFELFYTMFSINLTSLFFSLLILFIFLLSTKIPV